MVSNRTGWPRRGLMLLAVLALVSAITPALASAANVATAPEAAPDRRPNVVLILTDDLDVRSVAAMPNVRRLIAAEGLTFDDFFATTPLCCPSRATILRGQYAHNHGVLRNTGEDGGFAVFHDAGREDSTLATWLQGRGYRTALLGKYLNGYTDPSVGKEYVPPGWDEWAAGVDHDAYQGFDYRLNENGRVVSYGRAVDDYLTDVLTAKATTFVEDAAAGSDPFFLYLAPYTPHSPSVPAPRHEGEFADARAPRGPAFNETDVRDKPAWVRRTNVMSDAQIARLDADQGERLRSLQAIDEGIGDLVRTLARTGELENTYLVFTSDNGVFLGEHRQSHGKNAPYDPVIRVPLIVRGPGVPAGGETAALALTSDLAPTIADLAGADPPGFVDGRSLVPLLRGEAEGSGRRVFLAEGFGGSDKEKEGEGGGEPTPAFAALRSADLLYVEYETGERELYDLRRDPDQLDNRAADADRATRSRLSTRLKALRRCQAAACRDAEEAALGRLKLGKPTPSRTAGGRRADRPAVDRADRDRVAKRDQAGDDRHERNRGAGPDRATPRRSDRR